MWWWKLLNLARNGRRLRLWENAVKKCGITEVESSGEGWRATLTARSGRIVVWMTDTQGKAGQVAVEIKGSGGFSVLRLRRRSLKLQAHGIEVGDKAFDRSFIIEGPSPPVCALLDETMRRQIVRATSNCISFEIGGGKLRADVSEEALPRVLPPLIALGRRLNRRLDVVQRLAANAQGDPEAGVRLQNLLLLIREFRGRPATRAVLRTACSDQNPEIRLRAAKELAAKGSDVRDVLLDLAESAVDDAVSAEAVSILGRKLPFERARAILDQALDSRRRQTACACLETLGQSGYTAAVDVLAKVMELETGKVAAAAALALGATGRPAAQPPLLLALQREGTQVAAAGALARVGTAAAVPPLKEAAERFPDDQELQRATRKAIAEIKSRLHGASPGQLSLAGDETGQLSLAQTEGGELSLAVDPAGRLSAPPES
jgi:PBS lyase HEAT-like repeat-containing protein